MIKYLLLLFSITMFSQETEIQKYDVIKTLENIEKMSLQPPASRHKCHHVSFGFCRYAAQSANQQTPVNMQGPTARDIALAFATSHRRSWA